MAETVARGRRPRPGPAGDAGPRRSGSGVDRRRRLAGDPAPAAACPRASSPTSSGRRARTPPRPSASSAGGPRRSTRASAGPSSAMGLLEACLAEAADPGHEAADPGRVGAVLVAVGADQVGLLDGAHLELEAEPRSRPRQRSRARSGPSGRSRSSPRSSPCRSGCGRGRTSRRDQVGPLLLTRPRSARTRPCPAGRAKTVRPPAAARTIPMTCSAPTSSRVDRCPASPAAQRRPTRHAHAPSRR